MTPQDPLADLKPLHEPPLVDWWPPAPGWWMLAALLLIATGVAIYLLYTRWQRNAYRRQALKQLAELQQRSGNSDQADYATDLNALLKSTALSAYNARDVAASHSDQWRQFLNASLEPGEQFPAEFFTAAYTSEPPQLDRSQLQRCAAQWIRKHRVPS